MPRYIDRHANTGTMPPGMIEQIKANLLAGQASETGARGLNVFVGKDQTFCYSEAPNPEAVRKFHEGMGIALGPGDITEVQSLV